jgi:5-(carboxyamino)imidazole ribonucleotide mutase
MPKPKVGIVMGSQSDYETMQRAEEILVELKVDYEISVVSAHRTPLLMFDYASKARDKGLKAIIAGAGGAAHLPGMIASLTTVPVLGVPIQSKSLQGLDSLLSIVQMPAGVPTATFAIGGAGAANAALFAVEILSLSDSRLSENLTQYRLRQAEIAISGNEVVQRRLPKLAP